MKVKIFFFSGFLLTLVFFSVWQNRFLGQMFLSLKGGEKLLSPKGRFFTQNPQILGEITTLENEFDFGEVGSEEAILSQGAFVYDLTGERIIFEKEAKRRLPAASTVKIATAAVAIDKGKLEEELTVNYFPTVVGESSMNLVFGEKFILKDLLYGLLLVSGNDAAEVIAQGLAGKREVYVSWMNEFVKKLGATDTNFTTPSGLDEEGQYTSAYDLFLMGKHVFTNYPLVLEISTTREKYLPKTEGHRAYLLRNKLLLLNSFPLLGGKPGLGEGGKLSLVALLQEEKRKILVVLIRTPSIRHDLTQILKLL